MQRLSFLDLPIVLAPLGGVATVELVAAVCNAGGFGILPCACLTPQQIIEQIAALRRATSRPFGVNLFVEHVPYRADTERVRSVHERLRVFRDELGIPHPGAPALPPEYYDEQVDAIIDARPDVFTFTSGILEAATLERFRAARIFSMGTATAPLAKSKPAAEVVADLMREALASRANAAAILNSG